MEELLEFANDELLQALDDLARHPTPGGQRAFYDALISSNLILPAPPETVDNPDSDSGDAADDIPLLIFVNDAGDNILLAFTDEETVLAWDPDDPPLVALRGLDLVLIATQNDIDAIVLNPGSPTSYRMHRGEFAAVTSGVPLLPQGDSLQVPDGTTVTIAPPEVQPPEGWFRTVRSVLDSYPSIESAHFFLMRLAPEGARHVIGLALHEGMTPSAQSTLIDAVLVEFESLLPDGWSLDFVILDDADFLKSVQDAVPPIYSRV